MNASNSKNVLIAMSNTGGGHRASAEALKAAFEVQYGSQFQVDVVDLWMEHAPWPLNELPKSYQFLVDDTPNLYKWIWEAGEKPEVMTSLMGIAARWADKAMTRVLEECQPDLMIAVHPLLQDVPLKVLARRKLSIPFVTVLTDLATFHPVWFNKDVTLCFVPDHYAYRRALRAGLRPAQVRQYGLPIHPVFAQTPPPREELRRVLGIRPDLPVALLMGGGQGMGPLADIAQAVAAHLAADGKERGRIAGQLVVICGRNEKLQAKLQALSWPIPTLINGFVTNMVDWMAASDCLITKAGPGTIAEAMACGLPILLSGYIPGQEEGNVPYVVDHEVGLYSEDPFEIAALVSRWFGPERQELADMAQRARQLSQPDAVFHIVGEIASLLTQAQLPSVRSAQALPLAADLAEGV
jgi:1,2-diacylglycerol 3-beta-galactosyltransferase